MRRGGPTLSLETKVPMRSGIRWHATLVLGCVVSSSGLQAFAQDARSAGNKPPNLVVNVKRVLIPVVVRDRHGETVGDLKKEDFRVIEKGKTRTISNFTVEKRGGGLASRSQPAPTPAEGGPATPAPPPVRFILFLFDDVHASLGDLNHVKEAGAKMLGGALADSDYADVVSLSGQTNSGMTRDRARIQDAIDGLKLHPPVKPDVDECLGIDYSLADRIDNKMDVAAEQEAAAQAVGCMEATTPQQGEMVATATAHQVLAIGSRDVRQTWAVIGDLSRRMANLPGQRTLILVSPGFLSLTWEDMDEETAVIDAAAQSDVTINAIDARGLYTTSLTAKDDLHGRAPRVASDYRTTSLTQSENPMAELAQATGGTYFHNSNDLGAGFKKLVEAPETLYMLEISLDNVKPDGRFHPLKVTVDRLGLEIAARPGYFLPKPVKSKR